jgi:hypothetical protein
MKKLFWPSFCQKAHGDEAARYNDGYGVTEYDSVAFFVSI